MINYGFKKTLALSFDEAMEKVTTELQKEGFGVLSSIDLQAKLKEKLNVDYKRYTILGACNPPNAYKALLAEEDIGLLLPCNVILYDTEKGTNVAIIKPGTAMSMVNNPALAETAIEVEDKLKRVFEAL